MQLYKRHTDECRKQHGWVHSAACQAENAGRKQKACDCPVPDKHYRRCDCPIWMESNQDGKQVRISLKTSTWDVANKRAAAHVKTIKEGGDVHERGKKLADAIDAFLKDKENGSEPVAPDTLYRHRAVLDLLTEFCKSRDLVYLKDITLSHITDWQHTWTLKSAAAKRGRQEKIRNFIRFCVNHDFIPKNPLAAWKSVRLPSKDSLEVPEDRIIRRPVYQKIMRAIEETPMTPANRVRVKACMRLQREAGLAIVDAVTLHKDELVKEAGRFRIKTTRQKTETNVNVPISEDLGRFLLTVKNGNEEYFFWSGKTLPEDAPSYFQKLYRKVFKTAGVNHTSHDLRHTFAATFLEAGGDIRLLSKALGHSSVTITERYYAHFTKKQQDLLDVATEKAWAMSSQGD